MRIDTDLSRFVTSPVMIIVGTRDDSLCPEIGRAVGVRVAASGTGLDLMLSRWQWGRTVDNIRANGDIAVTFSRPSDYVSYQLKGRAELRAATPTDHALAAAYTSDMIATLCDLGLHPDLIGPWLSDRDLVVVPVTLREVYLQTPGDRAGTPLKGVP